ncbi:hypothetical protein [Methylobacterium sp. WL120]|uniref:hypothetical protein n=1 Tax=Methylobacterium sp. WL120 TaxID=2603887 RepID=UPI0011CA9B72|nr:hypothetical protein [Methylobacterium sp. WL120]TXM68182.1 hypothetical protein FV229_08390 [Methylobacterium sp. WL120]
MVAAMSMMSVATTALAEDANKAFFVQVWVSDVTGAPANPEEDPGRIEVTIAGRFVGCALAPFYRPSAGEVKLVPFYIGYTATGKSPEDIKVETYGELRRLSKPKIKISEVPQ